MKAITLIQPWASLIAMGNKKIETRSWKTNHRGPLAIHAGASMPKQAKGFCSQIAEILHVQYNGSIWYYMANHVGDYTFGHILATCELVDCCTITPDILVKSATEWKMSEPCYLPLPDEKELVFGDYTPGRYAWILKNVKQLKKPIPAKGQQGLWNWEPPEGIGL